MPRGVPTDLERRRELHARHTARMGEKIRFYRLLRRMTMQEVADAAGCSLHTIWRAETGRNAPRSDTQKRIARALGVDWWAIYADPLPETPEEATLRGPSQAEIPISDPLEEFDPLKEYPWMGQSSEENRWEGQELTDEYPEYKLQAKGRVNSGVRSSRLAELEGAKTRRNERRAKYERWKESSQSYWIKSKGKELRVPGSNSVQGRFESNVPRSRIQC